MEERRRAPSISLKAAVTGRQVALDREGVPLVLLLTTQGTTELVASVRSALRTRHPDPARVVVASIVNLGAVPRLMRKMAEGAVSNRFKEVAGQLAAGQDPRDYVVMLLDWKGEAGPALGLSGAADRLGVAVIDGGGRVVGTYQGDDPVAGAEALLAEAGA